MKKMHLLLFISAMIFISCSSEKEYPVKITEENGVKTVSNPDYPKEGVYDLVLDELFTLGKEEDNSKYIFDQPRAIGFDSKNNLYVHDADSYKFFVFDNAGNYLRQFGRRGQGPGDFDKFVSFGISKNNQIVVNDHYNSRICWFDLSGIYLTNILLSNSHHYLILDSKDNIYCIGATYDYNKLTNHNQVIVNTKNILRLNSSNNEWKTIRSFTGEKHIMRRIGESISGDGPYNEFEWTFSPDDKLYAGFADVYEFGIYDLNGILLKIFNRIFSPFVNRDFREGKNDPRYLPALSRYNRFDKEGNFWANLDNGEKPETYIYDVFSKDGVFVKQVYSKYRITQFNDDRVYSIVFSKADPVYVKAFKYSLKKRDK
jgi:uncharacterized protein YcfL